MDLSIIYESKYFSKTSEVCSDQITLHHVQLIFGARRQCSSSKNTCISAVDLRMVECTLGLQKLPALVMGLGFVGA